MADNQDDLMKTADEILAAEVKTQTDVQGVADGLVQVRSQVVDLQKQVTDLQTAINNGQSLTALADKLNAIRAGLSGIDKTATDAAPEVVVIPPVTPPVTPPVEPVPPTTA